MLGGGQGLVKNCMFAAQLHAPLVVVGLWVLVSVHAKMCCYSPVTAPLSVLDELGVVWFAAGLATGRSEKTG